MNVRGIIRYIASPAGLGLGPVPIPLAGPVGPPVRGKILRINVVKVGGPATFVTFRFKETGGGPVRLEFTAEPFPVDKQPLPVSYQVPTPSDLIMEVETDDGTGSTDLDFFVDIEGPY
jgi:hypothetical protein